MNSTKTMSEAQTTSFIKNFFTKGDVRTLRAKKNISITFVCKGLSMLISFLVIPITLGYVGKEEYGVWMTISSIISWFAFFDIGLGNGLRTKLAESLALNDIERSKIYVSSAFAIITLISLLMFLLFFAASFFVPWNKVLNTTIIGNVDLRDLIIMVFFFFCVNFITNVTSSILQAMQKYALNEILLLAAQILGLIGVFILVNTTESSLFLMCLVYSAKTAVVMIIATLFLFWQNLKELRPSLRSIQIKEAMPLINLGFKFFANQILYLIVTQTTLFIVVQLFGPVEVTVYNLALRYISITSMCYIMILTPYLSAFTEAYAKNDIDWIRRTIKQINFIWLLTSIATILMSIFYKYAFYLWVGDKVEVPYYLIIALCVSNIISSWSATYSLFLNGIGKVMLQFYILIVQALLIFPITYLFYKLDLGINSLIYTQIIFFAFGAYFMYTQYKKVVNNSAKGIWNK